ncbi:MAG: thermonuclease family protein [Rhizobiaceae bacterium]
MTKLDLEPVKPVRDVTPQEILKAPDIKAEYLERLPAVEPPPLPPKPEKPDRFHRPIVISAGILRIGDTTINLAGIIPLKLDQTCKDKSGEDWPCGRFAKTEFQRFIRGRPIDCNKQEEIAQTATVRCRLASYDISAWLVLTGWAEPIGENFAEELAEAQKKKRGIWRKSPP